MNNNEKSKKRLRVAVMLGVMAALSRQSSNPVKEAADELKKPLTFEDKQKMRGLKSFINPFTKEIVWAINLKNATKKFKRNA